MGLTAESVDRAQLVSALCDTLVPSLATEEPGARGALLARAASDVGLERVAESIIADAPESVRRVLDPCLDRLAVAGLPDLPREQREAVLREELTSQPLQELAYTVLALFYAASDDQGRNPNWDALGYPGPLTAPPSPDEAPKTIRVERVLPGATLKADVCVVGSGAGGSVVAATLQAAGQSVIVLERGGYRNESDFRQLEDVGARDLFMRGGMFFSSDGSLGLLAGATLGGGTVINSMVCLPPPPEIRSAWTVNGLDGLDGPEFDEHLLAVAARIGVSTEATRQNRTSKLLASGIERFGLTWQTIARNACPDDDPRYCGYCHNGCQQGCKQSTLKTYLQDAADAGAQFVVGCDVRQIVRRHGQTVGVVAEVAQPDGSRTELTVHAPTVVIAAGGIESPALLLRSGIGGPAVGHHLRVHPTYFVGGVYPEPVRGWEGQVQSVVSLDRTRALDGEGYLVECTTLSPGMWAVLTPWLGGEDHKRRMLELEHTAPWHAVCHDHGAGRVRLDETGAVVVDWSLEDPVDRRLAALGQVELAEMHRLAGARTIVTTHRDGPVWRDGDDFEQFTTEIGRDRLDTRAFSAHQMGSCRMGRDRSTSVANGSGELHDAPGVWVGDASAFPTAPGVNPMLSIMALARRTATRILTEVTA